MNIMTILQMSAEMMEYRLETREMLLAGLEEVAIPIILCAVMPIAIVLICHKTKRLRMEQKTALAMKVLESGQPLDAGIFADIKSEKKPMSQKEKVYKDLRLALILIGLGLGACIGAFFVSHMFWLRLGGCVVLCFGLGLLVYFFIARKHLADETPAVSKEKEGQPEASAFDER